MYTESGRRTACRSTRTWSRRCSTDVFRRYFLGEDPHHIEKLWRRVYSAGYTQHPDLTLMGVLSALEMACWDIIGKEAGQPVYNLLGGQVHERLRTYTYIYARPGDKTDVYQDPDLSAQRAAEYLARGSPRSSSTRPAPIAPLTGGSCRWPRSRCPSASCACCARRSAAARTCCSARTGR